MMTMSHCYDATSWPALSHMYSKGVELQKSPEGEEGGANAPQSSPPSRSVEEPEEALGSARRSQVFVFCQSSSSAIVAALEAPLICSHSTDVMESVSKRSINHAVIGSELQKSSAVQPTSVTHVPQTLLQPHTCHGAFQRTKSAVTDK